MDVVSLGFLLLMVLLGGVSAFVADSLAWRIGKKRLSLMNMRPKHFARLVVTVSGMLIPLVTILLVSLVSRDVRDWIGRGRSALQELPGVVRELDQTRKGVIDARKVADDLQGRNDEARKVQDNLQKVLGTEREELAKLRAGIKKQRGQLDKQSARIARLTPRLQRLTSQYRISSARVSTLRKANDSVKLALKTAAGQLEEEERQFKIVSKARKLALEEVSKAGSLNSEINARNLTLTQRNTTLETTIEDLERKTDDLQGQITSLEAARTTAEQGARAAQSELDVLQESVSALQTQQFQLRQVLGDNLNAFRNATLVFDQEDDLARIEIPAGASVEVSRAGVLSLLRASVTEAERRGARPVTKPKARGAADLVEREVGGRVLNRAEQIDLWATRAAGKPVPQVLVARAALNSFAGESVVLDLGLFPDQVVFREGAVVAEARVDGRRGDEALYVQITEFLNGRVKATAKEAGMIPRRERGEETFGSVGTVAIFGLMKELRAADRSIRLQAVALSDVRAGDPLQIGLRLRP